jgi:transposase InsO family protein
MKFGFIVKHRSVWPVAWLCEALGVSRSGFHAWLKRSHCARSREDDAIMPAVRASFVASDRTYGARRIWRDVLEAGFSCGLHKIERLMRAQALRARPRRRALPRTTVNVQLRRSRRTCSIASSRRSSPTANGSPTSLMFGRPRAGSTSPRCRLVDEGRDECAARH